MNYLLIVDDDLEIRELLSLLLEREGLRNETASSGAEALMYIDRQIPDLIVLDIMMEQLNGFELLELLRKRNIQVPIILLSAKMADVDKVQGFGLGADDYVTKPFSPVEMVARIQAHLRRQHSMEREWLPQMLTCGMFRLELDTQILHLPDRQVSLTTTEAALFSELMKFPNKVYTKSELFQAVWRHSQFDENTLTVYISRLRNKIGDNGKNAKYLQTIWGIGYRLRTGESE